MINVTNHLLHPPWFVRALEGAGLLAWARLEGLTWSRLGLGEPAAGCSGSSPGAWVRNDEPLSCTGLSCR